MSSSSKLPFLGSPDNPLWFSILIFLTEVSSTYNLILVSSSYSHFKAEKIKAQSHRIEAKSDASKSLMLSTK